MATNIAPAGQQFSPTTYIKGLRVAIISTEWNAKITDKLLEGAKKTFLDAGYPEEDIDIYTVPGAVELTFASAQIVRSNTVGAVIAIGCVIRGDTPHFDYVCESVNNGISYLNSTENIPVIFGVLTVENEQQALDRAGGIYGNKGSEFAETAIKMCEFALKVQK